MSFSKGSISDFIMFSGFRAVKSCNELPVRY